MRFASDVRVTAITCYDSPVTAALCVLGSTASAEPVYELLDVGAVSGIRSREINEEGQAIGNGDFGQGFFWDGTTLRSPISALRG